MIVPSASAVPPDLQKSVLFFCNGEIEISSTLKETAQNVRKIVSVDGGFNVCKQMNIIPALYVGDFDSISTEISKGVEIVRLNRDKDETDLEAAIKIFASENLPLLVYGGLGGRIDHTLINLFLAFRYPGSLFFESEEQLFFALSEESTPIEIDPQNFKFLSFIPLNGPALQVTFHNSKETIHYASIHRGNYPIYLPLLEPSLLHVHQGSLGILLNKKKQAYSPENTFALRRPLVDIFQDLFNESIDQADDCQIHYLSPDSSPLDFACRPGQVVSLIPFYGPAIGVEIQGLRWKRDRFDQDFAGLSNVCIGNQVSISLETGGLLCIIHNLIDLNLLSIS